VGGIPIYIHWSFGLLIAWIILSALWYSEGNWTFVGWRLLLVGGVVVSVILHELGHAFAAAAFRIPTRDITMYPFGGVASIEKLPESPWQELVIALAGPLVNFLITGVIAAGLFLGGAPWEMSLSYFSQYELTLLEYLKQLAKLNTYLALFNLLPAFPMDGGRVLRAFLAMRFPYARATSIAATVGQIFAVFFALLGLFGNPVLILIGFFVFVAAENEKKAVEGQTLLTDPQGRPVGSLSREQLISVLHEGIPLTAPITQVMNEHLIAVDANTPLSEVMRILQAEDVPFVLVEEKTGSTPVLLGIIDAENIAEYLLIKKAQEALASSVSP
jgi:Zn-dependent protease